jgi:D-inositol-3-phosphate glycosyltransferase
MQIAMLSVHSSPLARLGGKEAGGMNTYVRALAAELGQRGHTVDIFTRRHDTTSPEVLPLAPGVRLIHLAAGPPAPYDKNRILEHLPDLEHATQRSAQGRAYHLIHSHYWVSGELALRLRQAWGVPVVQMFHTLGALKNRVARGAEEAETAQRIAIERRLLHTVDAVVAATPIDREHMLSSYAAPPDRIAVIPPGVDLRSFRPLAPAERNTARARLGLPPDAHLLLWVGRVEPLKGLDSLIEALALLVARRPALREQVRLLLVGGEPETRAAAWNSEQRRLDVLRQQHGIAPLVTFAGAQPHPDLPAFYAAADLFVMPSHYESFGMAALEAMACGTPVVASDVGGLRILVEHGHSGVLVPPTDAAALAAHLDTLLHDDAQRAALRSGSLQRAAAYGWDHIAARLETLYQEQIRAFAGTHPKEEPHDQQKNQHEQNELNE